MQAESIQEACRLCDSVKMPQFQYDSRGQAVVTSKHLYRKINEYRGENKEGNLVPMWICLGVYPATGIPALVMLYSYLSIDGVEEVKAAVICSLIAVVAFLVFPLLIIKIWVCNLKKSDEDETHADS